MSSTEKPFAVLAAWSLTAALSSFLASEVEADARGMGTASSWLAVDVEAVAAVLAGLR